MRRTVKMMICLVVLVSCGCGRNTNEEPANTAASDVSASEVQTEPAPVNTVSPAIEEESETVYVDGPYGRLSMEIPSGWSCEAVPVDSGVFNDRTYGLILRPDHAGAENIRIVCMDFFGVCGTGLASTQMTLAGRNVNVGTYDSHPYWDYIVFNQEQPNVAAMQNGNGNWTEAQQNEAMNILDTLRFDQDITTGGIGRHIPEAEDDEIAVIMELSNVTPTGLKVHLRRYDPGNSKDLECGEGYSLQAASGDTWEDVPVISEAYVSGEEVYPIPADGETAFEINWEGLYGTLSPGTYRITEVITENPPKHLSVCSRVYPLTGEFIIAGQ